MSDYVLSQSQEEIKRLGFQHDTWVEAMRDVCQKADVSEGMSVLDIGCGPGYTSFELVRLVGQSGSVTGIDSSEDYLNAFHATAEAEGFENVKATKADVHKLPFDDASFDRIFARWVLCFTINPEQVINEMARVLKPGGKIIIQDYFDWGGQALAPRDATVDRVVNMLHKGWKMRGGDPDVGCQLPTLLGNAGLEVEEHKPLVRFGKPGSHLWNWAKSTYDHYLPKLTGMGILSEDDRNHFINAWTERESNPNAYNVAPMMIDIIATSKRGN